MSRLSEAEVWRALQSVPDPELPALSVVDLGIVRRASVEGGDVHIRLTPTYAGCPALAVIREDIRRALLEAGAGSVQLDVVLDPPWTTEWMSEDARRRLREFGIAPPPRHEGMLEIVWSDPFVCPRCGSGDTEVKNPFGPTACRSIHVCRSCREPFEAFKPM
ncbi:MAG: 1,2-phenylacetyl-CoA epoxidase subunit PaaD [Anaerolineales bacterium]